MRIKDQDYMKGCVFMPFKEINVKSVIEKQCENNSEFKKAWDASQMEYALIGQLIAIRKQKELSQGDLAAKLDKTQQTISRIENRSVNPSLKMVCSMADSLGYELKLVPKS